MILHENNSFNYEKYH